MLAIGMDGQGFTHGQTPGHGKSMEFELGQEQKWAEEFWMENILGKCLLPNKLN